ncbi:hypothetical protein WAI99_21160, partial [Acinetobacter baumannii]
ADEVEVAYNGSQSDNSTFELAPQNHTSTITPVGESGSNHVNTPLNENENNTTATTTNTTDNFTQINDMVASYQAEAKQQDLETINRHEIE